MDRHCWCQPQQLDLGAIHIYRKQRAGPKQLHHNSSSNNPKQVPLIQAKARLRLSGGLYWQWRVKYAVYLLSIEGQVGHWRTEEGHEGMKLWSPHTQQKADSQSDHADARARDNRDQTAKLQKKCWKNRWCNNDARNVIRARRWVTTAEQQARMERERYRGLIWKGSPCRQCRISCLGKQTNFEHIIEKESTNHPFL